MKIDTLYVNLKNNEENKRKENYKHTWPFCIEKYILYSKQCKAAQLHAEKKRSICS